MSSVIPSKLICPLCNGLFSEATMLPCCAVDVCEDCGRTELELSGETCPLCHQDASPDDLIPNRMLRNQTTKFRAEHPDLVLATPPKRSAQVLATAKASEVKPVEVSPPAPAPVFDSRIFVWSAAEETSKKDSSQTIGDGKATNPVDKDLNTDDKKSVVTPESKTLVSKKLSAKLRPHSSHAIVPDQNVPATMAIEPLNSSPSQNLDSLVKVVAPEDNPEHDVPPAKEESKTESGDTLWDIHAGVDDDLEQQLTEKIQIEVEKEHKITELIQKVLSKPEDILTIKLSSGLTAEALEIEKKSETETEPEALVAFDEINFDKTSEDVKTDPAKPSKIPEPILHSDEPPVPGEEDKLPPANVLATVTEVSHMDHTVAIAPELMDEAKNDPLSAFEKFLAVKDREKGIVNPDPYRYYGPPAQPPVAFPPNFLNFPPPSYYPPPSNEAYRQQQPYYGSRQYPGYNDRGRPERMPYHYRGRERDHRGRAYESRSYHHSRHRDDEKYRSGSRRSKTPPPPVKPSKASKKKKEEGDSSSSSSSSESSSSSSSDSSSSSSSSDTSSDDDSSDEVEKKKEKTKVKAKEEDEEEVVKKNKKKRKKKVSESEKKVKGESQKHRVEEPAERRRRSESSKSRSRSRRPDSRERHIKDSRDKKDRHLSGESYSRSRRERESGRSRSQSNAHYSKSSSRRERSKERSGRHGSSNSDLRSKNDRRRRSESRSSRNHVSGRSKRSRSNERRRRRRSREASTTSSSTVMSKRDEKKRKRSRSRSKSKVDNVSRRGRERHNSSQSEANERHKDEKKKSSRHRSRSKSSDRERRRAKSPEVSKEQSRNESSDHRRRKRSGSAREERSKIRSERDRSREKVKPPDHEKKKKNKDREREREKTPEQKRRSRSQSPSQSRRSKNDEKKRSKSPKAENDRSQCEKKPSDELPNPVIEMRNQIDTLFKEMSDSHNITDIPLENNTVPELQLNDKNELKVQPQLKNYVTRPESQNTTDEKEDCKLQQKENKKVSKSKENIWDEIPAKSIRSSTTDKKIQPGSKISFKITKSQETPPPKKYPQAILDGKQDALQEVVAAKAVKNQVELEETIALRMKSKWDFDVSEDSFETKVETDTDLKIDSRKIMEEELQDCSAKMLELSKKRTDKTDSRKSQEKMAFPIKDISLAEDFRFEDKIETNQSQPEKIDTEAKDVTFKNGKEHISEAESKAINKTELPRNERNVDTENRFKREKVTDTLDDKFNVSENRKDGTKYLGEDPKSGIAQKRQRSRSPEKKEASESPKRRERSKSPRDGQRSVSPKKFRRKRSSTSGSDKDHKRNRDKKVEKSPIRKRKKKAIKSSPGRKRLGLSSSSSIDDYSSTEMPSKQDELLEEVRRTNLSLISTLNAVSKSFIKSGLKPDHGDRSKGKDSDSEGEAKKKRRKKGKKEKKKWRDSSSSSDDTSSDDDDEDSEKFKKSKKKKKRNDRKRSASRSEKGRNRSKDKKSKRHRVKSSSSDDDDGESEESDSKGKSKYIDVEAKKREKESSLSKSGDSDDVRSERKLTKAPQNSSERAQYLRENSSQRDHRSPKKRKDSPKQDKESLKAKNVDMPTPSKRNREREPSVELNGSPKQKKGSPTRDKGSPKRRNSPKRRRNSPKRRRDSPERYRDFDSPKRRRESPKRDHNPRPKDLESSKRSRNTSKPEPESPERRQDSSRKRRGSPKERESSSRNRDRDRSESPGELKKSKSKRKITVKDEPLGVKLRLSQDNEKSDDDTDALKSVVDKMFENKKSQRIYRTQVPRTGLFSYKDLNEEDQDEETNVSDRRQRDRSSSGGKSKIGPDASSIQVKVNFEKEKSKKRKDVSKSRSVSPKTDTSSHNKLH